MKYERPLNSADLKTSPQIHADWTGKICANLRNLRFFMVNRTIAN